MTRPDPAQVVTMLLGLLRYHYKAKYAPGLLAIISARVCDEMGIDRQRFCELVLEEPKKTKPKEKVR